MAVNSVGEVFVCRPSRVQIFNADYRFVRALNRLVGVVAIAIDDRDGIFICDRISASPPTASQLIVMAPDGTVLGTFDEETELENPCAVCTLGEEVFVCDRDLHRVAAFSRENGELLRVMCQLSPDSQPTTCAVSHKGDIAILDKGIGVVSIFNAKGTRVCEIGPKRGRKFAVGGVCFDLAGNLLVADNAVGERCVNVYRLDGSLIWSFARGLEDMSGLCVDSQGRVFVCHGESVSVFLI